jgi:signal transduction histidine kinase
VLKIPVVPAEKQAEFLALRRRALLGEVFTEPELHRRRADGSPIVVSVSTSPLRRPDGTIYGIMSILMDVTERKAAEETRERLTIVEEQLRQSQKMEAVGRLAGGVAHDFNNLLTAISGYSDLLLHRLPDYSTLRRDVEEIRKAGDRAAALTRQLLAFSRRQVLQPKVLDLNIVVTTMEQMLRRLIGEDIDLSTELSPSLSRVKADPGQIEQVIVNLAVNARDAMPDGGRIIIATADAELSPACAVAHPDVRPGLRILYMSGYTDDAILRHGVLEGGIPFLQKPFTPEGLARKVREVLD